MTENPYPLLEPEFRAWLAERPEERINDAPAHARCRHCPLAQFLAHRYGGSWAVDHYLYVPDGGLSLKTPAWATGAIVNADNGIGYIHTAADLLRAMGPA